LLDRKWVLVFEYVLVKASEKYAHRGVQGKLLSVFFLRGFLSSGRYLSRAKGLPSACERFFRAAKDEE
jgi:hypothetical protein